VNILVAFASRHGNARGIAETIAAELEAGGHHTVFSDVSRVDSLDGFDAVVLGSGLYFGRWLPQSLAFLDRFRPQLATVPVWLFCSGQIGDRPIELPPEVRSRRRTIRLMEHRCFPGSLSLAPAGRHDQGDSLVGPHPALALLDWESVRDWARSIGSATVPMPTPASPHARQLAMA
jgi:menaquinone-dependent protoporphyrinogen oxidase